MLQKSSRELIYLLNDNYNENLKIILFEGGGFCFHYVYKSLCLMHFSNPVVWVVENLNHELENLGSSYVIDWPVLGQPFNFDLFICLE